MVVYDSRTGQYRDNNGQFVSRTKLIELIDGEQARLKTILERNAEKYINGQLDLDQWQQKHIQEMKLSSLRMTLLGAGGKDNVTPSHYGSLGVGIKPEWQNLDNFAMDLIDNKLSPKQIKYRAGLYSQVTSKAFYRSEAITKAKEGFNLAKRFLDPQARHCPECLSYQRSQWTPISEIVPPGTNCSCRGNCRCAIMFKKDYTQNLLNSSNLTSLVS